ncbi:type IV toxin-antitoxin system AbiEi family antitoxin domain-containing protein [Sphaerisporangium corydalis]|uniref:Type IV toxin-antitoxin system AbiEi family antitoxin domain-containing protein n=1 Tax=Sphaerisporangium corydalis TaxID=1441875 RepID=A0ABV9EG60_9ACTN|nr:type IV toxin-antitoxin system AbiEi family antitoxin domain-containing protein [Sphaerisporangium corydalis]
MGLQTNSRLEARLAALSPTFTTAQARRAAISSRDLALLSSAGDVDEISRGVYRRANAPATAHLDLLAVCLRTPRAVVCGESALAIHELIDDIPTSVHIAIPRGTHRPSITYPPTTVTQYAAETFALAIEQFEAAPGERVPIYSAARSVVDAMRHRRRFGETLALAALGRYLRSKGRSGVRDLQEIASDLGAMSAVRPAVEAVLA